MRPATQNMTSALVYADIFDYPLTGEEMWRWSVGGIRLPKVPVVTDGTYFALSGRKSIISLRNKRAEYAPPKWERVRHISRLFRMVPTVKLVGVTGGLAMDNADRLDDIDLFFIVRPKTLWISRLLVTLVAELSGARRRPDDAKVRDLVCLNMFMTEDALALPVGERDLFSAHEVLQMVPLWDAGGTYRKMLAANRWVEKFLPNAWKEKTKRAPTHDLIPERNIALGKMLGLMEPLVRRIQLTYMNSRRTNEVIAAGMIRFHPHDARHWIREKLAKRLKRWDIPLDKFFYHR